jgi:hypothetical protein
MVDEKESAERAIAELSKAWSVSDILLDFNANSARCVFIVTGDLKKTILFEDIIDIRYAPDAADSPPWIFGRATLEEIPNENALGDNEGLWIKGKGYFNNVLPCYRVSLESGDFSFRVLCRKIGILSF